MVVFSFKRFMRLVYVVLLVCVSTSSIASVKGITTSTKKDIDPGSAYTPRMLGLFIGVNDFSDPFWHDLRYPVKDAEDMVAFFSGNNTMSLDYKIVLTSPEETTRSHILFDVLDRFSNQNTLEDDFVFIYISGHGTIAPDRVARIDQGKKNSSDILRQYFVTSDTVHKKEADSAIAVDHIRAWFEKLRSTRKVLVFDMCHSGLGKSHISPEIEEKLHASKGIGYFPDKDSFGSIVLSSTISGGTSYEEAKLGNSVYTHFLLEGMKKGDLNRDGAITISEAHNYATEKTIDYTPDYPNGVQVPTAYSKILGKDPIYVNGTPEKEGDPTLLSYSSANRDVDVYVDGFFKGTLPKGMRIKSGEHVIECKKNETTIYKVTLVVKPGEDYLLPEFFVEKTKVNKSILLLAEGGYLSYLNAPETRDVTPESVSLGLSCYYNGIWNKDLALTGSFSYAKKEDIRTMAVAMGLKYMLRFEHSFVYAGPEVMLLDFEYPADRMDNFSVEKRTSFVCPGIELTYAHRFKNGFLLSIGTKVHYMPYKLNDTSSGIYSNRFFIGTGYEF